MKPSMIKNIPQHLLPMFSRSRAWKQLLLDKNGNLKPEARLVVADLARFCRANSTTFTPGDPHTSTHLEGRREVFTRIISYIGLNELLIYKIEEEEIDE